MPFRRGINFACSWRTRGESYYLAANSVLPLQTEVRAFILKSVVGFLSF